MATFENVICRICESGDNEETLLLCDGCDIGMHTTCIGLVHVPFGEWYCPKCRKLEKKTDSFAQKEVVLYERVSSKGQDQPKYGRVGLDTQNDTLLEYVCLKGLIVTSTVREVGSARNPDGLELLQKLVKTCKNKCILVYSASRFSRNLNEAILMLEILHSKGNVVFSVTENISSMDKNFLSLIKAAQAESDLLSRRMCDTIARIKKAGGHIGSVPFGKSIVRDSKGIRKLVDNTAEQSLMKQIKSTFDKLILTNKNKGDVYMHILDMLHNQGILCKGKPWTVYQIKKVIKMCN